MYINTIVIDQKLAEKRMSQTALAEAAGMCRQSVSAVLNRGSCSHITAIKIANALDVPVLDLIVKR